MKKYRIENAISGAMMGEYEAISEAEALDCMARDAGYLDYADACAVAPTVEGEIIIVEIDD